MPSIILPAVRCLTLSMSASGISDLLAECNAGPSSPLIELHGEVPKSSDLPSGLSDIARNGDDDGSDQHSCRQRSRIDYSELSGAASDLMK